MSRTRAHIDQLSQGKQFTVHFAQVLQSFQKQHVHSDGGSSVKCTSGNGNDANGRELDIVIAPFDPLSEDIYDREWFKVYDREWFKVQWYFYKAMLLQS